MQHSHHYTNPWATQSLMAGRMQLHMLLGMCASSGLPGCVNFTAGSLFPA